MYEDSHKKGLVVVKK